MTNSEIGLLLFLLFLFIASAHLLGYLFVRLRQPRVIGEILAGIVLGPSVAGKLSVLHLPALMHQHDSVLNFIYQLGLLLLMFISGIETRHLFGREERRQVGWLVGVGTLIPFVVALAASPWLPLERLIGSTTSRTALVLVIGIGVSVTSIPVISRIFYDLKILHTRFARLVLGVAVIEDIGLWAVLAVATALAASGLVAKREIAAHVSAAIVYFAAGMMLGPALLRRMARMRCNVLASFSPVGYVLLVLFAYSAIAAIFNVSLVFAAFLAGFGIAATGQQFSAALDSIEKFSFAVFIPVYFALVGYKLDLAHSLSFAMLGFYVAAACAIKVAAVSLGARAAGFRGLDNLNLSVAMNARGGPGIVLATVAFDAGIINPAFFTTLVLAALLTSQAAGWWLEFVLRKRWPLLSGDEERSIAPVRTPLDELAA